MPNTGLQNLSEDYLYDKLPPGIIELDERSLLRAVIGGVQDRLEDIRSFAKRYEFFFDAAGIQSHNTVVLVTFETTYGKVVTRSLDIQDDTPIAEGTALTAWAAGEMGVDVSQITSCVFGEDLLRFVDENTLQYLAASVGAVLYNTAAQNGSLARNQQRLMDSYFPRLKIKGTAQSFDVLGRLIGFEDVRMTPLWGRVSPRIPNDFGNPANDPDFSEVPVYTPQQVIGPSYNPLVFRDGPYYSWTGTASADPASSSFYTQAVNGFQPWVQVNITGTVVHPDPGTVGILNGGGPHTKATVEVGTGLQFAALAEGDDFNGLQISFADWNSGTNRLVSITDRLSEIKYRTSYFDLAHTMTDERAILLFGTNTARPNKDLQATPTLTSDGTSASPFRPWAGGQIDTHLIAQDFVYISSGTFISTITPRSEATIQQSQFNTDALQGAGQQALQVLEEVRPATRLPRRSAVGYLNRENVGYAAIEQFARLFIVTECGVLLSPATTAWADLVVANGGARPGCPTLIAVDTWYKALVTAGIDSLMINVGFFAPDSKVAALTPFFHTSGLTLWTDSGLATISTAGLLTTTSEEIFQGVDIPPVFSTSDMGLTAYTKAASGAPIYAYGGGNGIQAAQLWGSNQPEQVASYTTWTVNVSSPGFASGAYGWFSASRTATNLTTAYCANGSVPFASFGVSATLSGLVPSGAGANGIGWNSPGLAAGISQGATLSFMGCHHGLTSAQSQALFNATQALRIAFGGGYT